MAVKIKTPQMAPRKEGKQQSFEILSQEYSPKFRSESPDSSESWGNFEPVETLSPLDKPLKSESSCTSPCLSLTPCSSSKQRERLDQDTVSLVPVHVLDARRDADAQQHVYGQTYAERHPHAALPSRELHLERSRWSRAKAVPASMVTGVEDLESIRTGCRRAKRLFTLTGIVLGVSLMMLFALALVLRFVLGWTLEGDCLGCKYS
ncbi:hypothetical protein EV356DRAFT_280503 [Viridothelium virens]|uniref:Uncharacterized protein n=1 Tax=Viridothelium virens TaxID=1048519 RepID=A0A6A6H1T3_VIRVR|nr:hypothetical protein EV356DRAFT_280503 [Viridothelium virens]